MSLQVGVVGCGDIFPDHWKGWNGLAWCKVQAVFDADPSVLKRVVQQFGVKGVSSLDQLIDDCDVIDICTPPDSHAQIALAALEKRCHLLIEKPVVLSMAEWQQLEDRAAEVGAKICAGFSQKFLPQVQLAKKWVDEGRIGQVIRVRTEQLMNRESDRMLADTGHWAHRLPGGRWFETLPHDVYLTRLFAGPLEAGNVTALYGTGVAADGNADELILTLKAEHGLGEVHYSANAERYQRNIVITGSRGTIEITGGLVTTVSTLRPSRWKHEIGMPFVEAGQRLSQLIPDRIRWWSNRLKRVPPQSRMIAACARYFEGSGPAPTELGEIGNVVQCCEAAGRELEREFAATTIARPEVPAISGATDGHMPSAVPRVVL
jgi:UDP-N-acetyl-2-amino-2-deoxyglucuronate dehydrogenase